MAEKSLYWLHMQVGHGERARGFSVVFESEHASIAELADDLVRHGVVVGNKVVITDGPHGSSVIARRSGFAFGAYGLVSVQPYSRPMARQPA